jgi:hypothetical protein
VTTNHRWTDGENDHTRHLQNTADFDGNDVEALMEALADLKTFDAMPVVADEGDLDETNMNVVLQETVPNLAQADPGDIDMEIALRETFAGIDRNPPPIDIEKIISSGRAAAAAALSAPTPSVYERAESARGESVCTDAAASEVCESPRSRELSAAIDSAEPDGVRGSTPRRRTSHAAAVTTDSTGLPRRRYRISRGVGVMFSIRVLASIVAVATLVTVSPVVAPPGTEADLRVGLYVACGMFLGYWFGRSGADRQGGPSGRSKLRGLRAVLRRRRDGIEYRTPGRYMSSIAAFQVLRPSRSRVPDRMDAGRAAPGWTIYDELRAEFPLPDRGGYEDETKASTTRHVSPGVNWWSTSWMCDDLVEGASRYLQSSLAILDWVDQSAEDIKHDIASSGSRLMAELVNSDQFEVPRRPGDSCVALRQYIERESRRCRAERECPSAPLPVLSVTIKPVATCSGVDKRMMIGLPDRCRLDKGRGIDMGECPSRNRWTNCLLWAFDDGWAVGFVGHSGITKVYTHRTSPWANCVELLTFLWGESIVQSLPGTVGITINSSKDDSCPRSGSGYTLFVSAMP